MKRLILLSLGFQKCRFSSGINRICFPVAWRQPLRVFMHEEHRGVLGLLGYVVRLDSHLCRSNYFSAYIFDDSLMPSAIAYLVINFWCHRCFHSNFSQSKHQYILDRTYQLSKYGFFLLQNGIQVAFHQSFLAILASHGSLRNSITFVQLIIIVHVLILRRQHPDCELQIHPSILFF